MTPTLQSGLSPRRFPHSPTTTHNPKPVASKHCQQNQQKEVGVVAKANLRTVEPGESAPKRAAPTSVAQAAKSGTPRELLVAMRDRIAETVSTNCQPRDLAALTKRLQDIAHDIDVIDAREDADLAERVGLLERALRGLVPDHPLLAGVGVDDDKFDTSAI